MFSMPYAVTCLCLSHKTLVVQVSIQSTAVDLDAETSRTWRYAVPASINKRSRHDWERWSDDEWWSVEKHGNVENAEQHKLVVIW